MVGRSGTGTLNVEAGGEVSNTVGVIGYWNDSTGTATVTGANSQWNNSNSLYIGGDSLGAGGSGTLNLNDSGLVTVSGTTKLWSTGIINLDGGSLTTASFDNREAGTLNLHDGTLKVNGAGGSFDPSIADFTINGSTATDLAELVIANTASTALSGRLYSGYNNQGALTVQSGGVVDSKTSYIGYGSGSTGEATVTGLGSRWRIAPLTNLNVGYEGNGRLNVTDGGRGFQYRRFHRLLERLNRQGNCYRGELAVAQLRQPDCGLPGQRHAQR